MASAMNLGVRGMATEASVGASLLLGANQDA
jgi:hypothetical protein